MDRPGAIVALWTLMREFKLHRFLSAYSLVMRVKGRIENKPAVRSMALGKSDAGVIEFLDEISALATEIDELRMPGLVSAGVRLVDEADREGSTYGDVEKEIDYLLRAIPDHFSERMVMLVDADRARYFAGAPALYKQEVLDKFPKAIDDVEGAGKCLALGQGTACVLHLMRVMEIGLKALAKLLGIDYAPSWESYLTQIQTRIGEKRKRKGIKWRRDEPFFRDVSGDLLTVKQAFRNPTMHVVRKYDADEAEDVFRAVRTFMMRLSEKIVV